jgi:hypothetical protein
VSPAEEQPDRHASDEQEDEATTGSVRPTAVVSSLRASSPARSTATTSMRRRPGGCAGGALDLEDPRLVGADDDVRQGPVAQDPEPAAHAETDVDDRVPVRLEIDGRRDRPRRLRPVASPLVSVRRPAGCEPSASTTNAVTEVPPRVVARTATSPELVAVTSAVETQLDALAGREQQPVHRCHEPGGGIRGQRRRRGLGVDDRAPDVAEALGTSIRSSSGASVVFETT